jgi:hypothetical protein
MTAPAAAAVEQAGELSRELEQVSGLPWPATRAPGGEQRAYTLGASIDGRPARSASFWVFGQALYLPRTSAGG